MLIFKRMVCLALAFALCLGASALAEEGAGASYIMAGYDNTQYRDWLNNQFFARMEEKTGLHFDVQQYTDSAEWSRVKAAMKPGAELPDVLFKADLTPSETVQLDKTVSQSLGVKIRKEKKGIFFSANLKDH